ncbi:hypothetical protein [Burkholderia pseudomallei]|uniref:hypothetical protein n=1 Tax=Burkholderia pseudomallei TaxID=28450 RepID=UPI003F688CF7
MFRRLGEEWDGYTFALDALHDEGDVVIGIGRYSGTYRRTGKSVACRVAPAVS